MTPRFAIAWLLAARMFALDAEAVQKARTELFAGRHERAVELYRDAIAKDPSPDAYYGLTRALIRSHQAREAYTIGEHAAKKFPETPGGQTASGLALFRKGEIVDAEAAFRAALRLDPKYAGALMGLATMYSAISKPKTARALLADAYRYSPEDPALMLAHANTLKGTEHIAALETVLKALDPESEEARSVRVHIASDRSLGDRKLRRLITAYQPAKIKLVPILQDGRRLRGFGVRVQFNQRYTGTLLLDTGASGVSISPKAAEKAGLELLSDESLEAKGIGDKKPLNSQRYLASEVRVGSVAVAEYPVAVFRSAKDSDFDGIMGADFFTRFRIEFDFVAMQLALEPYASIPGEDDAVDAANQKEGFHRVLRSGDHLLVPTSVNGSATKWFLIDTGASINLIDTESAGEFTGVHREYSAGVRGVQGRVDTVSRADRVSLVFGGFRQDNSNLLSINLEKNSDSLGVAVTGVLGMPVLSLLKMSIDYREGMVKFERAK